MSADVGARAGSSTGACAECRRVKVKCLPNEATADQTCRRCARLGERCVYQPHRKGRRPTHKDPQRPEKAVAIRADNSYQILQSSNTSSSCLPEVPPIAPAQNVPQWPPIASSPYAVIQSMLPRTGEWTKATRKTIIGLPFPDQAHWLDPVTSNVLTMREAARLFKRYFQFLYAWSPLLDPDTQNVETVRSSSTFLFTVICAVSSIFCPLSRSISGVLMDHAKNLASQVLVEGYRSMEIVQAFAHLALYWPAPSTVKDDRSWLYVGIALRMFNDLGGLVTIEEGSMDERALSYRTYLNLYAHENSLSTQLGRPRSVPEDTDVIRRAPLLHGASELARSSINRLQLVIRLRQLMEHTSLAVAASRHAALQAVQALIDDEQPESGSYDLFIVDHVRLLVSLAPISVNEIGQEYDEEISQSVFHAAKTSVANSVIGLSDGGFLRFSSNLGVIMIMYSAVILYKMLCISDPDLFAAQSRESYELLRELSDSMLSAAASRNDERNSMREYGLLLSNILEKWSTGNNDHDTISLEPSLADITEIPGLENLMDWVNTLGTIA